MATNLGFRQTDSRQLLGIGAGLIPNQSYTFQSIPRIVAPYRPTELIYENKYFLPNLGNNLAKNKRIRWNPGDALPRQKLRNRVSAAFIPEGETTELDKRIAIKAAAMDEGRFMAKRLGDLQEIFPGLMSEAMVKTELAFMEILTSTDVAGAPISFSANLEDNPTTNAILEINHELEDSLGKLRAFKDRFKFVAYIGRQNWRVFKSLTCFTNFVSPNLPAAAAIGLNDGLMQQVFKEAFGLDNLYIVDGIYNAAGNGADTELEYIGNPCVFALIDRKSAGNGTTADYDFSAMSDLEGGEKPDGAIALGQSRIWTPVSWLDEGAEVEYFVVRWAQKFYSPRANDDFQFAIQFDSASIIAS
jgi:hypothetical protein